MQTWRAAAIPSRAGAISPSSGWNTSPRLFETGRWRRFHSERAFLENIQEAKAAVETWRDLMTREARPTISAIDLSGSGARVDAAGMRAVSTSASRKQPPSLPVRAGAVPWSNRLREIPEDVLAALESQLLDPDDTCSEAPALDDMPLRARSRRDAERYPLLRNA